MPQMVKNSFLTSLHVSLRDKENGTYRGNLILKNWTVIQGEDGLRHLAAGVRTGAGEGDVSTANPNQLVDPVGASYYVIAVVLVYGMSIVALIASHIKRKHGKVIEDKQINKYLREFQTVKDADSRESYKNLKKKIKEQIDWEKPHQSKAQNTLQQNLSHALLPMIAFGVSVPQLQPASSIPNMYWQRSRSNSLFNSQTSFGTPSRSRASSVGSHHSISSISSLAMPHSGPHSPGLSRDRHERKRGVANLFTGMNTHHEFPLEKILEESMSRENSVRQKGSKRRRGSQQSSSGSLFNKELAKGIKIGLSSSDFALNTEHTNISEEHIDALPHHLPEIIGSTSELGSSMEALDTPSLRPNGGASLGDSGMGRSASPTHSMDLGESAVTHMEKHKQRQQQGYNHHDSNNGQHQYSVIPTTDLVDDEYEIVSNPQTSVHQAPMARKAPVVHSPHVTSFKLKAPPPGRKSSSTYLNVPQIPPSLKEEGHVWVQSSPSRTPSPVPSPSSQTGDGLYINGGFRHSPSPTKSGFGVKVKPSDSLNSVRRSPSPGRSQFRNGDLDLSQKQPIPFVPEMDNNGDNLEYVIGDDLDSLNRRSSQYEVESQSDYKSHNHSPRERSPHDQFRSSPLERYYVSSDESDSESELLQITCV